jgi:hypothetical protein
MRPPHIDPDKQLVIVCAACLTACCWQGTFPCSKSRTAGTRAMVVGELRKLKREHPNFWQIDRGEGDEKKGKGGK